MTCGGTLHWLASLAFATMIVLHIILHWGWIKSLTRKYLNRGATAFLTLAAAVFMLAFLAPYYVTKDLPKRKEFSSIYQKTTYYESERIQKELGGVSPVPHLLSGPWRTSPEQSE